jgi:hypothetical protein
MFERMRGAVMGETTAAPAVSPALVCICTCSLCGACELFFCRDGTMCCRGRCNLAAPQGCCYICPLVDQGKFFVSSFVFCWASLE